jgi:hypothetical protein
MYYVRYMNKEIINIRISSELKEKIREICDEIGHGLTRTDLVEWACEWYAAAYDANGRRPLTSKDMADLMDYLRGKAAGEHPHAPRLALVAEDAPQKSDGGATQTKNINPSLPYSNPKRKPQNKKSSRSA